MCHSNPKDNSVGGSVMNSFAVALSAAQQDTVVASSNRMVMAMRTSPPGLRISEGEVYYKLDREGARAFSMSNVKRPMSNVKCICQITQPPTDQMTQSIWSFGRWVIGSSGQVHLTFDMGRLTFDI